MTATDERVDVSVDSDEDTTGETDSTTDNDGDEEGKAGRKRDRDFTKFTTFHKELSEFVNANSGLESLTPNQVKAVIALRTDFNDTPEQEAKRAEAKRKREEEAKKYEGLTDEQKKAAKAAEKIDKQAASLEKRLAEARARAKAMREGKEATGEDLAAAVTSAQNGSVESEATPQVEPEPEAEAPKRKIGRR